MINADKGAIYNRRLFITDRKSKLQFLVDSGSDISLLPASFKGCRLPSKNILYAANGTTIKTFGTKFLSLDFGLKRSFNFTFVIANVSKPILGVDFLDHFHLLVDVKNRKLIDPTTNTGNRGVVLPTRVPSVKTIVGTGVFDELIREYPEITQPRVENVNIKHDTVHYIKTFGPPVAAKVRRLSPVKLKAAKAEFDFMLKSGICRPSKSPWASALHMVPKNNSDWRPTGDYRALNLCTQKDKYPLPNLQDFSQNLHGSQIFTKIDLVRAFNQIPVHKDDVEKTAVITPFGLFEFIFLPYGLCNAPQTFQRFINEVLFDLDFVFAYIDDILIASKDLDEHLKHIRIVFERFKKYGLTMNVSKCDFGKPEVSFLGHLVNASGIKPLPHKVDAIVNYPRPRTIKDLRRFLGCLNFYRRFIPKAAELHAPLNTLLSGRKKNDNRQIVWTDLLVDAFEKCKQSIVNIVQLSHPESDSQLVLFTDASDVAVGSALHKLTPNGYLPLSFYSTKLNNAQQKYSAFDKELLAIYLSIIHFRYMLEGRNFHVITDHKPLTHAFAQKFEKCSPRRLRQLEFISQFTTDLRYLKGSQNLVADALSRIEEIVLPVKIDYIVIAEQQLKDDQLKEFLENVSETSLKLKLIKLTNPEVELYFDTSQKNARLYVPVSHRRVIFNSVHSLAHPSARTSLKQICTSYVWPSMRKDIVNWCRTCIACQKAKVGRHTRSPLSTIETPNSRFAHVNLDLIGPLPIARGFRYCLTVIDRYTRWIEVVPLVDITAESVSCAFLFHWVARFGPPARITTDQGRQLESATFKGLMQCLGTEIVRTTAYNPKANGLIERQHRTIKAALMCYTNASWIDCLPLILLGLRTAVRGDWDYSSASLVYGQNLRLPGQFFIEPQISLSQPDLIIQLQKAFKDVKPSPTVWHGRKTVYVPKNLSTCSHVFQRVDLVRKSLQPPYEGPFKVIKRMPKIFLLQINNKERWVSVDRLKPAFLPVDESAPAMPASVPPVQEPTPNERLLVSSQPPRKEPRTYITRSGRQVRFRI